MQIHNTGKTNLFLFVGNRLPVRQVFENIAVQGESVIETGCIDQVDLSVVEFERKGFDFLCL
jgi:hypothetical protein